MIDARQKERLVTLTVESLLTLRSAYLRTGQANALKHWDILQSRARAAARTTASPEEWATKLQRDLQIPSLSSLASSVLVELVHVVTELGARSEWLDLIEREHGYLIALARLTAEKRKEERDADHSV
jgi:hypothetical protein